MFLKDSSLPCDLVVARVRYVWYDLRYAKAALRWGTGDDHRFSDGIPEGVVYQSNRSSQKSLKKINFEGMVFRCQAYVHPGTRLRRCGWWQFFRRR